MEPVTAMFPDFPPGLNLYDWPLALSEMTAKEIIVIYLAEETYPLGILTVSIRKMFAYGYFPYFRFRQITNRENEVA